MVPVRGGFPASYPAGEHVESYACWQEYVRDAFYGEYGELRSVAGRAELPQGGRPNKGWTLTVEATVFLPPCVSCNPSRRFDRLHPLRDCM